jgi:hypothetical protein
MYVFCKVGDELFSAFKNAPSVEVVLEFLEKTTVPGTQVRAQEVTDWTTISSYPYSIEDWDNFKDFSAGL